MLPGRKKERGITMKRMAVYSAVLASAIMLTACGTGSTTATSSSAASAASTGTASSVSTAAGTSDSDTIVVTWWGNQTRNDLTQQVLDKYSSENNVTFDGQFSDWANYWSKTATSSAGQTLPDILQMDYAYLAQYAETGQLADLTPYVDDGTIDVSDVSESILASGEVDGKLYAIPLGINAPTLVYNKTLLDENGISIKDNMSMEEFYSICQQVYEKTGYKTDVFYGNGNSYIEYVMRDQGAVLFEEGKLGATAEQLQKYFDIYEKGISEGWMCSPEIYAERSLGSVEQMPLVYGSSPDTRSWCAFSWSNSVTAFSDTVNGEFELGITNWPADNEQAADYLKPSMFFCISATSTHADEAAAFLNYWTNDIEANQILLAERGVPISSKVSDAISDSLDEINQSVISYINDNVSNNCSAINPPAPEGSSEVTDLINSLTEQVCYQSITAEEAADQLYTQGNSIMASKS